MSTDTALLVIDVQVGIFSEAYPVYDSDALLMRIGNLIRRARSNGVPVIYVQHNEDAGEPLETNTDGWRIHPSIAPIEGDTIIQKRVPDSFHETNLKAELDAFGINRLVLSGLQTDFCVNATCRRASQMGYDVVLAKDAHSTIDQEDQTAREIIEQYNELLCEFADVVPSEEIFVA